VKLPADPSRMMRPSNAVLEASARHVLEQQCHIEARLAAIQARSLASQRATSSTGIWLLVSQGQRGSQQGHQHGHRGAGFDIVNSFPFRHQARTVLWGIMRSYRVTDVTGKMPRCYAARPLHARPPEQQGTKSIRVNRGLPKVDPLKPCPKTTCRDAAEEKSQAQLVPCIGLGHGRGLKPLRTAESTPGPWRWPGPGFPSRPGRHRWRADHRDSGRRGELGWRGEWCGSGGRATSCLKLSATTRACHAEARLTLQDIEADATQSVNVWVVDLGQEAHLWRGHGVVVGQEQLELEHAA